MEHFVTYFPINIFSHTKLLFLVLFRIIFWVWIIIFVSDPKTWGSWLSTTFGRSLSVYAIIGNTPSTLGESLTEDKALPIHLPAASMNPLQSSSACLHLRLLQLSHLSSNFFLHSSFFSITSLCASCKLFSAASKAALTAFAASSKAWRREVLKMSLNEYYRYYVIMMIFSIIILYGKFSFLSSLSVIVFQIYKGLLIL